MANDIDQAKLSSPRIFLIRMLVFVILCGLIAFVLQRQIVNAFLANPWLNGLIIGVLLIGIILSFHQVIRLFPEVAWVNGFRRADPKLAAKRAPKLLAPMAAILGGERVDRVAISAQTMRAFLDSLATPARRGARHFPLSDRPAGLPRPARHVLGPDRDGRLGRQHHQRPESRRRRRYGVRRAQGRLGRAARRHGHFVLVLAVRPGRLAGPRLSRSADQPGAEPLLHQLEDWLATTVQDLGVGTARRRGAARRHALDAIDRLRQSIGEAGTNKATTAAMANLAEAIQGLVHHMRTEQQMIRDWADEQSKLNRDLRRFMEHLAREAVDR